MNIYAFLLTAVPQAPATHAGLHPDTAFAYAELPDVRAMIQAYEKSPVVQMVRDEAVRKAVYGTLESFDVDLDEHLASLGSMLGLPADRSASPVTAMVSYLWRLRSASVSLTFQPNGAATPIQAAGTTLAELAAVAAAIEGHRAESGELPAGLSELELDDTLRLDAWGHAYAYARSEDGASFTLVSYGADGKPGGEGANADFELGKEEDAGKRMVAGLASQVGALAVLSFDDAANAKWAHELFLLGMRKAELSPTSTRPVSYRGAGGSLELFEPSEEIDIQFWAIATPRDLVLGAGAVTAEAAIALADGRGKSLAGVERFASLPARLPAPSGVPIGHAFIQSEGMLQIAYQGGPETEALRELLQRAGGETYARMNLVGERFVTEMVTTPSSKDYFGKSMGQAPVPPELWKCIPDDAIAFYATSVDGAELYKELMIALSAEGNDLQSRVDDLEAKHGIDLERDLFANLSGGIVGYLLGIKGFPPGMAVIADVKDAEAFTRGMRSLLQLVSEQEDATFSIKENPYKYKGVECPKWTFSFSEGADAPGLGGIMTPTPTVAIVKNRVVLTLFSTRATKEIKRLLGDEGAEHPLLHSPARPPAKATVVGYMDWAELIGGTYKTAMGFASMAGGALGGEAPVDFGKLPEASVFTRFFKPTVLYAHPIEGGTYTRLEASFGPETWVAFLGGITAGAAWTQMGISAPDVPEPPVPPTPPQPGDVPSAEAISTEVALDTIQTAVAVFKAETGKLPASLDELVAPTRNYPRGFFNGGSVPKDGWGRAFRYATGFEGKAYRLWSLGADGEDQQGAGDDIVSD